jgi:hypothetical protein
MKPPPCLDLIRQAFQEMTYQAQFHRFDNRPLSFILGFFDAIF